MKRRLFIAINLPKNIKETIKKIVNDLRISINQRVHQHKSTLIFESKSIDLMESQLKRTAERNTKFWQV